MHYMFSWFEPYVDLYPKQDYVIIIIINKIILLIISECMPITSFSLMLFYFL